MHTVVLVLHRTVIGVLGFPTIGGPKVGCLKAVEGAVVLHRQHVIVDLEQVAVRGYQMRDVKRVL